jgi:Spy/CpxP family protein refolding chaperone
MTTTKSLFVAALLSSVTAVSFAQAPDSRMSTDAPSASVATTVHHQKHPRHHHHHHHHHAHHNAAAAEAGSVGK